MMSVPNLICENWAHFISSYAFYWPKNVLPHVVITNDTHGGYMHTRTKGEFSPSILLNK